jgi:hypothetical protein
VENKKFCTLGGFKERRYTFGMAQRRMLSVRIINSARFLQMPLTAHALYFHLALQADDDGVVESFPVMRMTGAAQDDLKILLAKNFIKQLNDEFVVFVTDWHEHNFIRPDRKVNSVYQHLLKRKMPEAKLIPAVARADRPQQKATARTHELGRPKKEWDDNGTEMGRHRLGKVRLNNNVNDNELGREKGANRKTELHLLPNLQLQADEAQLIADDIVEALGDEHSRPFYTLVAMKIPENVIRQKLAEIKQGGAHSPAKAFTSAMKTYATTNLQKREISALTSATQAMFKI